MAPVATQPLYAPTSGFNTPDSQLDGPVHPASVHPTAARRPYSIVVHSDKTTYSDNFITSKYENRGANVVTSADGQVTIVPTVRSYEFKTARKVQKTGYVHILFTISFTLLTIESFYQFDDGRYGRQQWLYSLCHYSC